MERYREVAESEYQSSRIFPSPSVPSQVGIMADVLALTRALVDIESVSGNEAGVATYLFDRVSALAARHGGRVERLPVDGERFNVFASWGEPIVTLSTHMDTVPPFFPSREDDEFVWGRGACDAKGAIAAMIGAAETLAGEGACAIGLLFVVGEEINSAGAKAAALSPRGSRYLINGEPTESKLALAAKGALRYEIRAAGKMAHSGYPELGESAIDKMLDVLETVRRIPLPRDPVLGPGTINIGRIAGGRAPNVVADEARAEIFVRLVGDPGPIRDAMTAAVAGRAELREIGFIPAVQFDSFDGLPTTIVSYTSDAPILSPAWGKPLLIGPGSIRVAHTEAERMPKRELEDAVGLYAGLARRLLKDAR
jgi:acetylornithine deacetylase